MIEISRVKKRLNKIKHTAEVNRNPLSALLMLIFEWIYFKMCPQQN